MTISVLYDVSDDDYYAGLGDAPMLSYSTASKLVHQSPRHAYCAHPKLGGKPRKQTAAQSSGSIFDALMTGQADKLVSLGPIECPKCKGKRRVKGELCDRCGGHGSILPTDLRPAAAKAQWEDIEAKGSIPILPHKLESAMAVAVAIRTELAEQNVVLGSQNQVTLLWEEKTSTGHVVQCCGRLDNWHPEIARIYDFKRIDNGHPDRCQRSIEHWGYNIQAVAYRRGIESNFPELVGRVDFVDLFCEIDEEPYLCTPIRPRGTQLELGRRKWQRAIDTWYECVTSGEWPGYASGIISQDASEWALKRDIEQTMSGGDVTEEW
jgi:hypothetical protein